MIKMNDPLVPSDLASNACAKGTTAPPENPIRKILLAMKCSVLGRLFVWIENIHGYICEFKKPRVVSVYTKYDVFMVIVIREMLIIDP